MEIKTKKNVYQKNYDTHGQDSGGCDLFLKENHNIFIVQRHLATITYTTFLVR